jgi:hypothetical protein
MRSVRACLRGYPASLATRLRASTTVENGTLLQTYLCLPPGSGCQSCWVAECCKCRFGQDDVMGSASGSGRREEQKVGSIGAQRGAEAAQVCRDEEIADVGSVMEKRAKSERRARTIKLECSEVSYGPEAAKRGQAANQRARWGRVWGKVAGAALGLRRHGRLCAVRVSMSNLDPASPSSSFQQLRVRSREITCGLTHTTYLAIHSAHLLQYVSK